MGESQHAPFIFINTHLVGVIHLRKLEAMIQPRQPLRGKLFPRTKWTLEGHILLNPVNPVMIYPYMDMEIALSLPNRSAGERKAHDS